MKPEAERDEGGGRHDGRSVPAPLLSPAELRQHARRILGAAWRADPTGGGFCVPHPTTYPWQWLWDSCFHAVVWAHLGDDRAVAELRTALSAQDGEGFVPHLRYPHEPHRHAAFWGRADTSSITQPPMYGHAVAVLAAAGAPVDDELLGRADAGLRFLLEKRVRSVGGLVELCHPWESGCDDSPRWDSTVPGGWSASRWYDAKGSVLAAIERSPGGAPLRNPAFPVASVGFSALVAWNARELAGVTGDAALRAAADDLAEAVDARWDPQLRTWLDDGPTASASGRVRTLDALLPVLLHPRAEAFRELTDPSALGAPCGPRGVHRAEPAHQPDVYWRGSAWPQLGYLVWLAATRSGEEAAAASLSRSIVTGASRSGFAEHWVADTGAPLGAVPQSWSTLASVVSAA